MKRIAGLKNFNSSEFFQKYTIILVWIGLIILYSCLMPDTFATWRNVTSMLSSKAVLAVLALAIMIPLIAGDYDMSVAANMTLGAMLIAVMNVWWGVPIGVAIIVSVAICAGIGAVNGIFAAILEVDAFVVTMGMQTLLAGIIVLISNSATVTGVSEVLTYAVYRGRLFGISYVFYYAIAIAAICFYFFTFTAAGRRVLIVGRGRNVARLSGINVKRVRFLCFVASGALSGIAGMLYVGVLGAADVSSGLDYIMPAFAAVFLSTTVISTGKYNPWGCIVAVYFLVTGTTGLSLMGVNSAIQDVFYGGALIVAVVSAVMVSRGKARSGLKAALAKEKEEKQKLQKVS
ncbi:MAG: ABC transporter permease [Eubacterium sp.]|nr:ABC transporter permease [Eubacterium sp.]